MSIPRWICKRVSNVVPIGPVVLKLSQIYELMTPNPPCPPGIEGLMFSSCPFPDEYPCVCQIWSRSVQLFGIFSTFLNLWPPDPLQMPLGDWGVNFLAYVNSLVNLYTCAKCGSDHSSGLEAFPDGLITPKFLTRHAPRISRGYIFLAHVHSQMNMHTFAKYVPDRYRCLASFPQFCMCDSLTPSKYPVGLERLICLADVHSQMNLNTCVKFGPDRSSGLRQDRRWRLRLVRFFCRCWRGLAQKHAKKQHLYIENYNSGPNILTTTSLTFFTAIFIAFRGSLAEVLMVMCRQITTE